MIISQTFGWVNVQMVSSIGRKTQSSRMLKKAASGVLASLRDSTYRSVRLVLSLVAALPDSLFEHPAVMLASTPYGTLEPNCWHQPSFSEACWGNLIEFRLIGMIVTSVHCEESGCRTRDEKAPPLTTSEPFHVLKK